MGENSVKPYKECPQFHTCSCNVCPLDPDAHSRIALKGEERCVALRRTRAQIAARYLDVLPSGGLLLAEIARDKRKATWAALPADDPRKVALSAMQGRFIHGLRNSKGSGVVS